MQQRVILEGMNFWQGDIAIAEGAIAAGCRFFAGYPITPASEVAERLSARLPLVGGIAIQMENEIASMLAVIGASWGGVKAMTATSGPGMSLKMEAIGLAAMMEVPCVVVNVQRAGPSTGLPTLWAQADVMQARWGSHGDYEIIALAPSSAQQCFDLMIDAFNLAEEYRVPVIVLADGLIGHMTERVIVPPAKEIEARLVPRKYTKRPTNDFLPYKPYDGSLVPDLVKAGDGYYIHTTGLTHDERGYPQMSAEAQERLVKRLVAKIRNNAKKIARYSLTDADNADVIIVTFGMTSRFVKPAIEEARRQGVKVGHLRLITVWPFPEWLIEELAEKVSGFCVVEMNLGQIFYEVERCARGKARTVLCGHAGGGLYEIEEITKSILDASGAKLKVKM